MDAELLNFKKIKTSASFCVYSLTYESGCRKIGWNRENQKEMILKKSFWINLRFC